MVEDSGRPMLTLSSDSGSYSLSSTWSSRVGAGSNGHRVHRRHHRHHRLPVSGGAVPHVQAEGADMIHRPAPTASWADELIKSSVNQFEFK